MKPRIIIRADAGPSMGMGHVIRCLALADMLRNDFEITFAIQNTSEDILKLIRSITDLIIVLEITKDYNSDAASLAKLIKPSDIVLLDGYNFKTEYQKAIKITGCKLVCIDDLHSWHHVSDIIINHAEGVLPSDYSTESYTRIYLGLKYVLLRKIFLESSKAVREIKAVKRIFISMGAADIHNLTQKFLEAILEMNGIEEIHLMLGTVNPHLDNIKKIIGSVSRVKALLHFNITADELKSILQHCDLAICPASSISLECCAVGIGLISGYTADNQKGILSGLIKYNSTIDFGELNNLTVDEIKTGLTKLFQEPEQFNRMVKNQKGMIDGKSPERLLEIFRNINKNVLRFRFAEEKDAGLYFKWANDPIVRQNSYRQENISYEDHVKWFLSKLKSKDCFLYLFTNTDHKTVGQVRIERGNIETTIGISVDGEFRGMSLGTEMARIASNDYLEKNAGSAIFAYIKRDNSASLKLFKNAGFTGDEIIIEQGVESYKLCKKIPT